MAQDVLKFNGSLLVVRAVMLTGVTGTISLALRSRGNSVSSNLVQMSLSKHIYTYLFKNALSSSEMTSSSCRTINDTSA
jgi:hypothetical protein